ncbi:hypothetical protein [Methylobacterium oryzae]|uniref:hypothetical protein n=1 Tax=Methylobacterium oryzae TaxID=334852 RepID=UPI002F2E6519
MLDLALALVVTPAGITALLAIVAAGLAVVYAPRLAVPFAALAVILVGVAYVTRLRDEVASTRRERDEARELAEVRGRAVSALQREHQASAKRTRATAAVQDRIRRAPASDDGPVAPVLRDALEAGQ